MATAVARRRLQRHVRHPTNNLKALLPPPLSRLLLRLPLLLLLLPLTLLVAPPLASTHLKGLPHPPPTLLSLYPRLPTPPPRAARTATTTGTTMATTTTATTTIPPQKWRTTMMMSMETVAMTVTTMATTTETISTLTTMTAVPIEAFRPGGCCGVENSENFPFPLFDEKPVTYYRIVPNDSDDSDDGSAD